MPQTKQPEAHDITSSSAGARLPRLGDVAPGATPRAGRQDPSAEWAREDGLSIPDLKLLRRIGSGSYGEVWMAQAITGALRAVKVVWREDFEHEKTFHREFEGIQQFEPISRGHPGLVNILHVGWNKDRGFYYYVMELADDAETGASTSLDQVETYVARTLSSDFKRLGRLDLEVCKQTGVLLADALSYMHSYGLTHRDIKPSNIIFVKGVCKLADIGLVAAHGEHTFVGTEGFVPPEGPGTFSADLFSLGKVLYEISSGNDRMDFPAVPDNLTPKEWILWREWNEVICRACMTDVKQRFANAAAFAVALREVGVPKKVPLSRRITRGLAKAALCGMLAGTALSMAKRERSWRYVVTAPDAKHLTAEELAKMLTPTDGKVWIAPAHVTGNPTGIKFFWGKDRHLADRPVSMDLFNEFLNDTMQSFEGDVVLARKKPKEPGKPHLVVFVPKKDADKFCDWLTLQDRAAHALTDDYEYHWKPDPEYKHDQGMRPGWNSILLEVVKLHFGQVVISSNPPNAEVFEGTELLGITDPTLTLSRVRVGDFSVVVHLQGYKKETLRTKVLENQKVQLTARLKATGSVVFGTRWRNSLEMDMVPLGNVLIAAGETRRRDFAVYFRHLPTTNPPPVHLGEDVELPMTRVSRADAVAFCEWLSYTERRRGLLEEDQSYRLPTDDEWSMVAGLPRERGSSPALRNLGVRGIYPWGQWPPPDPMPGTVLDPAATGIAPENPAIAPREGATGPAPVGSLHCTFDGVFDLAGNVWQWISDEYGGPDAKVRRFGVVRGGSWRTTDPTEMLSSYRRPVDPNASTDDIGFRIVLSPVNVYARGAE